MRYEKLSKPWKQHVGMIVLRWPGAGGAWGWKWGLLLNGFVVSGSPR